MGYNNTMHANGEIGLDSVGRAPLLRPLRPMQVPLQ